MTNFCLHLEWHPCFCDSDQALLKLPYHHSDTRPLFHRRCQIIRLSVQITIPNLSAQWWGAGSWVASSDGRIGGHSGEWFFLRDYFVLTRSISSMPQSMSGVLARIKPPSFQQMCILMCTLVTCEPWISSLRIGLVHFTAWWVICTHRQGKHECIWAMVNTDQTSQLQCAHYGDFNSSYCGTWSWRARWVRALLQFQQPIHSPIVRRFFALLYLIANCWAYSSQHRATIPVSTPLRCISTFICDWRFLVLRTIGSIADH